MKKNKELINSMSKKNDTLESYKKKKIIFAYVLLIPFSLGFILFFLQPLVLSFIYSLNNTAMKEAGANFKFVGLEYYKNAILVDLNFRNNLISGMQNLAVNVPIIVIFSLFIASLLNKKFAGRDFTRVVLFLPVIITTGVLLSVESTDYLIGLGSQSVQAAGGGAGSNSSVYSVNFYDLKNLLLSIRLPSQIMNYLLLIIDRFYSILISSGVQITILLAALQSIPPSLYEASSIEGATGWEDFWKITLPMTSSYVFVCALYTIIDTFTNPTNEVIKYIRSIAFDTLNYGLSSAMAWIYFGIIGIILLIVFALFFGSKFVFYQDK